MLIAMNLLLFFFLKKDSIKKHAIPFQTRNKNKARLDKHCMIITISINNQHHGNIVGQIMIGLKPFLRREML